MYCNLLLASAFGVGAALSTVPNREPVTPVPVEQNQTDMTKFMDDSTPEQIAAELGFDEEADARLQPAAVSSAMVVIDVNISTQRMNVRTPQGTLGPWKVSTAGESYADAIGTYSIDPTRMYTLWKSIKYHGSPMPHAQFYKGGYAIHGTYATGHLGAAASHGCVRLSPKNAATLYSITKPIAEAYGLGSVIIRVHY